MGGNILCGADWREETLCCTNNFCIGNIELRIRIALVFEIQRVGRIKFDNIASVNQ